MAGSRSLASQFNGMACPYRMDFSLVHGTNPGVGTIVFDETDNVNNPIGTPGILQIGFNTFVGIIIFRGVRTEVEEGSDILYRIVDMRDRLHDVHIYGAFNVIDQEGRMYHILPKDWKYGRRTYISRLNATEWEKILEQNAADFEKFASTTPVSAATLLNLLARDFEFTWTASPKAFLLLKILKPENLDWSSGVRLVDGIQEILDKGGLQFTEFGNLHLHITIQGWPEDSIQQRLLQNAANLCALGFSGNEVGSEINTKGRRVVILGQPNKYQFKYGCVANWNQRWDFFVKYNEVELKAVLIKNSLTMLSLVGELPEEWRDPENWNGKPRNDMTVADYLNEVVFKCYVVDFNQPVSIQEEAGLTIFTILHRDIQFKGIVPNLQPEYDAEGDLIQNDEGAGFQTMYWGRDEFEQPINSIFPISDKLINFSDRQFLAYATTHRLLKKGSDDPFDEVQQTVPITNGVSLEIEEILNHDTSQSEWRVRVVFSDPRYLDLSKIIDPDAPPEPPPLLAEIPIPDVVPDVVYVDLCTDREIFVHKQGELGNNIRVREQKIDIPGLRRNFLDFEQVALLAGNLNKNTTFEKQQVLIATGQFYLDIPERHLSDFHINEWDRYENFITEYSGRQDVTINEKKTFIKILDDEPILWEEWRYDVSVFKTTTVKKDEELVINPIKADEIAPIIAQNNLFHNFITTSGGIRFEDSAGFVPDGLVQSVVDSWDSDFGIVEQVHFSNDYSIRRFVNVLQIPIKEKEVVDENVLVRQRMEEMAKAAMRGAGKDSVAKQGEEQLSLKAGGEKNSMVNRGRIYGDEDTLLVLFNTDIVANEDYKIGELIYFTTSNLI